MGCKRFITAAAALCLLLGGSFEGLFGGSFGVSFVGTPAWGQKPPAQGPRAPRPLTQRVGESSYEKGLSGRHIALWASHGLYWNGNEWTFQRAPLFTTVEDVFTLSYVNSYLAPTLERAGACVLMPRERDFSQLEFSLESTQGSWTLDITQKGHYALYITYDKSKFDKVRYTIHHAGGKSEVLVNQTIGYGIPVYLGSYDFSCGKVVITNDKDLGGLIKIGGGTGASGYPRYCEGARYYLKDTGAETTVWNINDGQDDYLDDLKCRGAWVNWLSAGSSKNPGQFLPPKDLDDKQPAARSGLKVPLDLALAFHTDAGVALGDTLIGTLAIYSSRSEGRRTLANGDRRSICGALADSVQSQVVGDIRALFDTAWVRRELFDKLYNECRTPEVPSMILELLSHQNFNDMKYGLDPRFQFTVSRAVYKGILRFLAAKDKREYLVAPLPVHGFSALLSGHKALLSWEPTLDSLESSAVSEKYLLYTRIDSNGFDCGRIVDGPRSTVHLEPGHVYSWKVEAFNKGGRSFPSEILSAGIASEESSKKEYSKESSNKDEGEVLIVNGFTRLEGPSHIENEDYAGFLDKGVPYICNPSYIGQMYQWKRDIPWKSDLNPGFGASLKDYLGQLIEGNTFDYVSEHGRALLERGRSFCSQSVEAFCKDSTKVFAVLDLILGEQVEFERGLESRLQQLSREGSTLVVSGSHIGNFCPELLGYEYAGDIPTSGEKTCAGLAPVGDGAKTIASYPRCGVSAAVEYITPNYKAYSFGFPLFTLCRPSCAL